MSEWKVPYIAIEGCIGVGKSTVAQALAEHLGFSTVLEDVDSNPFLASLYSDPQGSRVQAMLTFLCIHYHQLYSCFRDEASSRGVISDFFFPREELFADTILRDDPEGEAKKIVLDVFQYFNRRIRQPNCVVYLRAQTEFLISRIVSRARGAEIGISDEYIDALNRAYERFFVRLDSVPVIIIEQARLNDSPANIAAEIAEGLMQRSVPIR
jgi:deoxyadenosine/deoxycytidine kinase